MKKVLYVCIAAAMLFAGCGGPAGVRPAPSPVKSMQPVTPKETQAQNALPEPVPAASPGPQKTETPPGANMVDNGDFSNNTDKWQLFLTSGGSADFKVENGEACVDIKSCGGNDYSVQLYYDGFKLETGGVYMFAFDARSSIKRTIGARLQLNGGDYTGYADKTVELGTDMQRFEIPFTMEQGTDPAPRLCFNIGTPQQSKELPLNTVYFDNVEIKLTDASGIIAPEPEAVRPDININQIGYDTDDKKTAVLRGDVIGDTFQVIDENGGVAVEGKLTGPIESAPSGETNYIADFSALNAEGVYTIKSGSAQSAPFRIADNVYSEAFKAVLKMLYLQRCGTELTAQYAGDFAHDTCHTGKAVIYGTNKKVDVSGGWHDAGDYGRYVVSGAKAVADLLFAYQDCNGVLKGDALGIPESGNGVPDVLDEARYELVWMLKMQEKQGGVYHKVTGLAFPGEVMPTEEKEQMYVLPVSNTATADFAAVMAMSYSVYKEFDAEFADTCLAAAVKAWSYLEGHAGGRFENPEDVLTGEYYDGSDSDERYWAAAALYKATGDKKYLETFEKTLNMYVYVMEGYGWKDMGGYGNKIYLSLDASETDPECVRKIKTFVQKTADEYMANTLSDAYGLSLGLNYPWGSNMTVCDNANYLYWAGTLLSNGDYTKAIDSHFNYIFGANPMSTCYVTGFGTVSPLHCHHRPSMALAKAMPGMLAGGPDKSLEDPYAKAVLADAPPAKCYVDNTQSFSTNEVAIYWNSALVYLMAQKLSG